MTDAAAGQAQSTGALPGTLFHAPAVHLLEEPSADAPILVAGTETGISGDYPVHADIERAEITQVHHGMGQMSITLNNQRHERGSEPRPIVPAWRYNALNHVQFGQRMVVKFGYAMNQPGNQQTSNPDENFQRNLMLRARVTDMNFTFPNQGGSRVTLKGEDPISVLNARPNEDKRYRRQDEIQIVRDVLVRAGGTLSLADGPREQVSGEIRSITHSKGTSYFQFIESLAKRLDYEVWADIDDPDTLHFQKSRSLELGPTIDLSWNKNLVDFKPRFQVWDIHTGAEAGGRNPERREPIREVVAEDVVSADLHTAPDGAAPISAVEARSRFFSGEGVAEENLENVPVNNLDSGRVRLAATAALRRSARQFLTADATTIGLPHLRPGIHVNLQKLYAPFDGIYYVTEATHTIDNNGYQTKVKLRRPGMLDPDGYPGVSQGSQS